MAAISPIKPAMMKVGQRRRLDLSRHMTVKAFADHMAGGAPETRVVTRLKSDAQKTTAAMATNCPSANGSLLRRTPNAQAIGRLFDPDAATLVPPDPHSANRLAHQCRNRDNAALTMRRFA
jgi:hypothetical protein